MAVPDFQSFMLPLLRISADGEEYRLADARALLADEFRLTDADRNELLPSGRQSKFSNRVAWAKVYLAQAGLLLPTRRGHFRISDRGREVLRTPPARIDVKFLEQFPEFLEFRTSKADNDSARPEQLQSQQEPETPEETLDTAHLKMRGSLATELLARIKGGTSGFFERLVVELLLRMGYGGSRSDAGQAVGKAGDEGIDGVISEDRLVSCSGSSC